MSESNVLDTASKRLAEALDALEAAVDHRHDADREVAGVDARLHAVGLDRSRLASELDTMSARARRLEDANRDVSRRLDQAMESIRMVIGAGAP